MKPAHVNRLPHHTLRLRPLAFALFGASLCAFPGMAGAQVVVAGGNTKVYQAPNGVQVVDIATANNAGVSHNVFTEFNVARNGMVLNNGDSSQMTRQSQLAGQVSANLNLNNSARIILNEVTGASRSTLAGHMEVLGSAAEVVIANPYGITCDGCGFINTPRATLSTGVPVFDAEGRMTGLRVGRGDIVVSGTGLNGTGLDYLDLVARSIRIDGQVNAGDLTLAAGANHWDYASRSASASGADTAAPALGIDSSALGGMYANRIRLMATEEGVGVRLLGDAAASAAELAIDARGQITLQGRFSAQAGDIAVNARGQGGGIAVSGRNASISAAGDVALKAAGADIVLEEASLRAGRDLNVNAGGALRDAASAGNTEALRHAGGDLSLTAAGKATIAGSTWGADGALGMRTDALQVGAAAIYSGKELTLATTNGSLQLDATRVTAHGALALDAGQGALGLDASTRVTGAEAIALDGAAVTNAGSVIGEEGVALHASSLSNSGLLQAAAGLAVEARGQVVNSGSLLAGGTLGLRAASLDNRGVAQAGAGLAAAVDTDLINSGKLLATNDMTLSGRHAGFALDNHGLVQAGGALDIGDAAHRARLNNGVTGTIAAGLDTLVLESLVNAGILQAGEGLLLTASGDVTNTASGLVLTRGQAGAALSIDADGALRNHGALQSDGNLDLTADGALVNTGTVVTQARADGGADGDITLHGASIDNSGAIGAAGKLDMVARAALTNTGTAQAGGPLAATVGTVLTNGAKGKLLSLTDVTIAGSGAAFTLTNNSRIQAGGTLAIGGVSGRADLTNTGDAILSGSAATLALGVFGNDGLVAATAAGGSFGIDAASITNAGTIESSGSLALGSATTLVNRGRIVTLAGANGGADGAMTLDTQTIDNSGVISSAGSATLAADGATNSGTLQGAGDLGLTLDQKLDNSGKLLAGGALRIDGTTAAFDLGNSGRIQSGAGLTVGSAGHRANIENHSDGLMLGAAATITAGTLDNAGTLQSGGALTVDAEGDLDIRAGGQVLTQGGALTLSSRGKIGSAGALQSSNGLALAAGGALVNSGSARSLDGTLAASGASVNNSGFMHSAGNLRIGAGTGLDNSGTLAATGGLAVDSGAQAFTLDNKGRLQAGGLLELGSVGHLAQLTNAANAVILGQQARLRLDTLNNSGVVQGGDWLDIGVGTTFVNAAGATLRVTGSGALTLQGGSAIENHGSVIGAGTVRANAAGKLTNSGNMQGNAGLALTAGGIDNSGKLLSGAALTLANTQGDQDLKNSGRIQAGTGLTVGGPLAFARIDNTESGIIVGGALDLDGGALTNAGLVQGDSLDIDVTGKLENTADAKLLAVGGAGATLALDGAIVDNKGLVQSNGNLALTGASVANMGKLVTVAALDKGAAGGTLTFTSSGAGKKFENQGEIASNGALTINVAAAASNSAAGKITGRGNVALQLQGDLDNDGRIAAGGDLDVQTGLSLFKLDNDGDIESGGALAIGRVGGLVNLDNNNSIVGGNVTITANALHNKVAQAKILTTIGGGGTLTLSSMSSTWNAGTLHADGALNLTAMDITNTASGGISARGGMVLGATRGNLVNHGWVFGTGSARLTTLGGAITNEDTGNIEVVGDLSFRTLGLNGGLGGNNGSVSNYNNVHTQGNLSIETGAFLNQSGKELPTIQRGELKEIGLTQVIDSGNFNCNKVTGKNCAHSRAWRMDFYADQTYSFTPKAKAQLLADGNIKLTYWESGANKLALISGRDVSISKKGVAGAFVNADMLLQREYLSRLVWIRADDDEVWFPTSEAAYNDLPTYYGTEEAPRTWHNQCNDDWWGCSDADNNPYTWLRSGTNYLKLTGSAALEGRPAYNAGIYASGTFTADAPITLISKRPTPLAADSDKPKGEGSAAGVDAATADKSHDRDGLAGIDKADADDRTPDGAEVRSKDGLAAQAGSGAAKPGGLTPVLVNGAASGLTTVVGANGVPFTGPNLALPTSPNGLYVPAAPNNTQYLVETNPLFVSGSAFGSNYLAQRLGFDTETVQKRLGDANYEAKLVRDQLVAQTNNYLLGGYTREADQMKALLDNAASQSAALGLSFGTALSAEQAGKLTEDMVWMVETSVNGQKVLAPVVYLSAATRAAVLNGSVISARDVRIEGDTLVNQGGTIVASNDLTVKTRGDITNTGGTIRANTVALTSTEGSIVNETAAVFRGDDTYGRTTIGPTGTIEARDSLALDAARDVRVIGADLAAGGNATIKAGNDVVFDTIQDKRADTVAGSTGDGRNGTVWSRNEVDVKQIGANVSSGGNLSITSGNDVTVAGSTVKADGKVGIDAGRDLKIVDRQDLNKVTDMKKEISSGFTAKGGAVGYARTDTSETTKTTTGTSVGSTITSGGDTSLSAGKTLTVRGSDVAAGGDLAVHATDVKLLAGQDTYEQTIDKKTTTTGVSVGVDLAMVKSIGDLASGGTSVAEVARAAADVAGNQGVSLSLTHSTTSTHSQESNSTARVSSLTSGGKTSVTAGNNAMFEGTRVVAGGDIDVKANTIDILEARNKSSYNVQSETTGLNVSVSADPMAMTRKAVAENLYSGGGEGVKLATVENTQRDLKSNSDKSTVASFTSGGSITREATDVLTERGAQFTAAGDLVQRGKEINQLAAIDTSNHEETVTVNKGSIGVSVDFETTKAFNDLKGGKPGSAAGLLGGPTIGMDANYTRTSDTTSTQTTAAQAGNLVAGGKIITESSGATRMEGTRLSSGGDTSITAGSLQVDAARNTTTSTSNGSKINVDARVELGVTGDVGAKLGAGYTTTDGSNMGSQAVTGSIAAGGNLTIKTTGDARFEGTQLAAAKDASIDAGGRVDMVSADSTASTSASTRAVSAEVNASKGSGGAKKGAGVNVKVEDESTGSTTAQVGSIQAGNNLTIKAKNDLTLVGTTVGAGNDVTLGSDANVNLLAAKSSTDSDSTKVDAGLSGSRTAKAQSVTAKAGVGVSDASTTTEKGSDLVAGNKLVINSGGKTDMQGTQIDAGQSAEINATGGLTTRDAVSTSSQHGVQVDAYVQVAGKRSAEEPTSRPRSGAVDESQPTRARADAVDAPATRERGTTVTEAPEQTSTWTKVKEGAVKVKDGAVSAKNTAKDLKSTTSLPLAWASKTDESDSQSTAVAIRTGDAADTGRLAQPVNLMALPAVKSAVQLNAALAAPLAQYGSQAAIPDTVKRAVLQQAGVAIPPGADLNALLKQTQSAGKDAAIQGLSTSNLNAEQHAAALKQLGLGN